ncbi:Pentatricopeptide repeat-containing protein At2g04860 [Linum perenne]
MNLASSVGRSLKHNLSFFHSLLKSQVESGNPSSKLVSFRQLLQSELVPNDLTFSLLPSFSSNPLAAKIGAYQIQTHLIKLGIDRFVYVGTALLDLFMKLGCTGHARKLFDYMPERDDVSWNALICGYSRNGHDFISLELFIEMLKEGFTPSSTTLVGLVPSCGRHELLFQGRSVHGFGVKGGLVLEPQVQNVLTSMYAKCCDLASVKLLFEEMKERSVVSWNTVIGAYGQNGSFDEAMIVFNKMRESVEVNPVTIISLLSANCTPELIHCYSMKTGLVHDGSVATSLVCTYAKQGSMESAELLYRSSQQKRLVSLTAIISGYAEERNMHMVMDCFSRMQHLDMKLDSVAMVCILNGIVDPMYLNIGVSFHCYTLKNGLSLHTLVANGLISMYSKLDDIEAVFLLFAEIQEKRLITWNSVISGCIQAGRGNDALQFFCKMRDSGQDPDAITIACLLSACSQLGYLKLGMKLHNYVLRNSLEVEDFVGTALVDMYTKCGNIVQAERVFNVLQKPCLATWNTMISGYSWYGFEHEALSCYSKLLEQGLVPDRITFLGVLAACTHGGLVHEGKYYIRAMTEQFGISPDLQHCACMVGLFGRAGLFEEALLFIKNTDTEPDSAVWGALLGACCIHQEAQLGEYLAKKMYLLDRGNGGLYVLMSNLYAAAERWEDVARVRELMRDTGGDGCSGVSQIELNSVEHIQTALYHPVDSNKTLLASPSEHYTITGEISASF